VSRLRPELRLQPLLPTQLFQALFAIGFQLAFVAALLAWPTVKVAVWGAATPPVHSGWLSHTLPIIAHLAGKI
jgi:hypothetical protein